MTPPTPAPPPWTCKCTVYVLFFYISPSGPLPVHLAYAPLEASTPTFSSPSSAGEPLGGLAFAQIIRYTDTPVGPYDELAILPGAFAAPPDILSKTKGKGKKDLRITGIWVSSEASMINGRRNWNIPKHMARFAFTPVPGQKEGVTKVEVFEPEGERPFFSAVIHKIAYAPPVPFSSGWMDLVGISTRILQPPLPEGEGEVEVGTGDWKRGGPTLWCGKARAVWVDMRQSGREVGGGESGRGVEEGDGEITRAEGGKEEEWENWWPGMRRWNLGLYCPDAVMNLGAPEAFES